MNLNQLTLFAIMASYKAGVEIMKYYDEGVKGVQKEKDKHDSPLTIADLKAHEAIEKFLRVSTKDISIFSEESKEIPYHERRNWKEYWLVDPLDGTKEFLKRNGEFTVNVALIRANSPVIGIVYAPALSELYFANEEIGSFGGKMNIDEKITDFDKLLSTSERLKIDNNKFKKDKISAVVSRSYLTEETEAFLKELQKDYSEPIEKISFGSSLKFCRIAENRADIYPNLGNKSEWDIAAGHCVLKFSGGNVLNHQDKSEMKYNKVSILTPFFIAK